MCNKNFINPDMNRTARENFIENEVDAHLPFDRICSEAEMDMYEETARFIRKLGLGDEDIRQILSRVSAQELGQIMKALLAASIIDVLEERKIDITSDFRRDKNDDT